MFVEGGKAVKVGFPFFGVALGIMIISVGFAQSGTPVADVHAADDAIPKELRKDGIKYETERAIVWAEKGSLTKDEVKEFGQLVTRGIREIEKYTGIKFDKQHYRANKIEYFLSRKAGISHASVEDKPFVYLTPQRVREKKAPYLHETTHVLLWKDQALWLQEGFPSYIETYVEKHYGGYSFNVFNPENRPIDELASQLLKAEISAKVLPLIGMNAVPKEEEEKTYGFIFEDRKTAAPAFYNLSESFVKYLVERVGMKKMRRILEAEDTRAGIEKTTGRSVDEWKTEWLRALANR